MPSLNIFFKPFQMAPNVNSITLTEAVKECKPKNGFQEKDNSTRKATSFFTFESKLVWRNVIVFILLHIGTFYGLYLCFAGREYLLYGYCK